LKIRTKVLAIILVLIIVTFSGLLIFSYLELLPSFDNIDKKETENNLTQLINAVSNSRKNLEQAAIAYGAWDATYSFAENPSQQYIDFNYVDNLFETQNLNLIAIVDNQGNILYCQSFNLTNSQKVTNTPEITSILQSQNSLFPKNPNNETTESGLVNINNQPMIVASAPILTSTYQGPSRGRVIFGQYFDGYISSQLKATISFNFSIKPITTLRPNNSELYQSLQASQGTRFIDEINQDNISSHVLYNDIHNESTFVLTVTNNRVAYQQGQFEQTVFLGGSFILTLALVIGLAISLEISIVRPMKALASTVKSIPLSSKHFGSKIKAGSDELNLVAIAVRDTLDKKFEAMSDVSLMVAHDLRNPLAGIKNAAYLINKRNPQLDDESKLMLKNINECVEYSNNIVSDLLDFSREIKLDKTKTTPKKLVDSSLLLNHLKGNVEILNETDDTFEMFVDVGRINRVFSNLVKNAFDAMPDGGTLKISNRAAKNYTVIEFIDSGSGMSKQTLEKLWTPFFTTKLKGLGIGLPICKKIVEAHGGKIEVSSVLNEGTTFSVYLPIS
jgi:signal transduction histidine kinase